MWPIEVKRNALCCVRIRNVSTEIKISSASTTFASICTASHFQDVSHFARRNLLAELEVFIAKLVQDV